MVCAMVKTKEDLTGQIFGRWRVIEQADDYIRRDGKSEATWLCECRCEAHTQKVIRQLHLKNGSSQSCGCLQKELVSARSKKYNECGPLLEDEFGQYYKVKFTNSDEYFLVDAHDWEAAKKHSWLLTINSDGYKSIKGNVGKKLIKLTEFIGCKYYDHINRNSLDCRRRNLRPATIQENARNKSKRTNNTSGCPGVYFNKQNKKWCAQITIDKKAKYLGSFILFEDAVRVRKEAEKKYFKDFAPKEFDTLNN